MRRKLTAAISILMLMLFAAGCSPENTRNETMQADATDASALQNTTDALDVSSPENETVRDFALDQVLETDNLEDIHFNISVPEDYDRTHSYALHIALPGWEGLYFQGVGEDLRWEYVPHESTKYIEDMIVASLQLNSWDEKSASQAVRLTKHLMEKYSIDKERIYITGYSAGGETLSRVLELNPELYRAALFMSSKWDGDPAPLIAAKTRLYLFTSEHDSYYGAEPARQAWQSIHDLYEVSGMTEDEILELLVLDIREDAWFDKLMKVDAGRTESQYATDYHGAGMLAAFDEEVMRWVFR